MKEKSFISSIGVLLYVVLTVIDRFFFEIPDNVYIPLAVSGIAIIFSGFIIDGRKNK